MTPTDSFPRRQARTQRFTLGAPRNVRVASDGSRVAFCRSAAGDDPVNQLWVFDTSTGTERLVFDPRTAATSLEDLPDAERARRERAREGAGGIVSYDCDSELTKAVFTLGGALYLTDLLTGDPGHPPLPLEAAPGAHDARLSPDCSSVAYVSGPDLRVTTPAGSDRLVAAAEADTVSWGAAEFVAAEEMGRTRGHWWSADSTRLLAARVDVADVSRWWIADPASPGTRPTEIRYPEAGGTNASVELAIIDGAGARIAVDWARGEFEYLADASWAPRSNPTVVAMTRDQRTLAVLEVDPETGETSELTRQTDAAWVELVPGSPRWTDAGLLTVADLGTARRLLLDGTPVTPADLQVLRLVHADETTAVVIGTTDATESHVYRIGFDGTIETITETPGIHSASAAGDVVVVSAASLDSDGTSTTVFREGRALGTLTTNAHSPGLRPEVTFLKAGDRAVNAALLLPADHDGESLLPVLLDPYGGPHASRVQKARSQFLTSQWFADQGFAVLVADGRGTPGRDPEWERAVRGDLAQPVLDDQVAALETAAAQHPFLDTGRVAIRGWSFGGYLAALAVLRRPDVFHAAVAGAPVTDWRLYDTFYTERYLGDPHEEPETYARCDLLSEAAGLSRPLLLIHGFADDNVVVAHTLQLSRALLEAGRPHAVLPMSGVTHMTPQEAVAENLLVLQVEFLRRSLLLD